MMKKWILGLLLSSVTLTSFADTVENAKAAKKHLSKLLKDSKAISIGIGACDPYTGKITNNFQDFVYCVIAGSSNKEKMKELLVIFPLGTRIHGSYVVIRKTGTIRHQPRIGGGIRGHE